MAAIAALPPGLGHSLSADPTLTRGAISAGFTVYTAWASRSEYLHGLLEPCEAESPESVARSRRLRFHLRTSLVLSTLSVFAAGLQAVFGHPATAVGFALLAVVGTLTTLSLCSAWKARRRPPRLG